MEILKQVDQKNHDMKSKIDNRLDDQFEEFKDLEEDTDKKLEEINEKLQQQSMNMKMGPYANKFADLQNTDASHGLLLHEMIQDNASQEILSAYISNMREGAIEWINPANSFNALQLAYFKLDDNLITLIESHCDEDMLRRYSTDKTRCTHDAGVLGSYLRRLVTSTVTEPHIIDQGRLLHTVLKNDGYKFMVKRMSPEVKNYRTSKGTTILDIASKCGGRDPYCYDMFYKLLETPANKKRQQHFQSKKHLPNGTRVRRGRDYEDKDEDGDDTVPGTVIRSNSERDRFKVKWDNCETSYHSFGRDNKFELRIID
eukprot:TRINITY_DN32059_c2_g1_i1.p1 TRINITY_DN32059_c2_g1~~TRINITY_DN32059_c2_g1_i1.p1  ORF type:complete len:314 (-),score=91.15 TRINITY_DN32059_c2_g1_i1:71-1012(-)